MSKAQKIHALEALLARIRSRAAEPRRPAAPAFAAVAESHAAAAADSEAQAAAPAAADLVFEVDVRSLTSEPVIEVSREEAASPEGLGSRERLVAAQPVAPEAVELPTADVSVGSSPRQADPEELADEADVVQAEDLDREAPRSSRRPVAPEPEERLAEMAFGGPRPGEEEPPLHTPPPESGRLPAVPQEPQFDTDVTGVRQTAPMMPVHADEDDTILRHAHPGATLVLQPEATQPELPTGHGVVSVIAQAQAFRPDTFVALIDASVAL